MCCSARKVTIVFSALIIVIGFLHFLNVVSGFRLMSDLYDDNGTAKATSATASFGLLLGAYGIYVVMHDKVGWIQLYGYIWLGVTILAYLALVGTAVDRNINAFALLAFNFPISLWITLAAFSTARAMRQMPPITAATGPIYEVLNKVQNI